MLLSFSYTQRTVYLAPVAIESVINRHSNFTSHYGIATVIIPGAYIFGLIHCLRVWLLYFDINIYKFHMQKAWLKVIDPKLESTNWFNNKQATLGNSMFLLKYGITLSLFCVAIGATFRILHLLFIDRIFSWFIVFTFAITATVFWCKLRKHYNDPLAIKKELSWMIRCAFFYFAIGVSLLLCLILNVISEDTYDVGWRFMACSFINSAMTILSIIPRYLCMSHNHDHDSNVNGNNNKTKCGCFQNNPCCVATTVQTKEMMKRMRTWTSTESSTSQQSLPDTFGNYWTDIVCSQYGYESFMQHLLEEFSIENLLFCSEVYIVCLCALSMCLNPKNGVVI